MNAAGSAKRPPLAIPGRLYVAPTDPAVVELDVAAGWMTPKGILGWTREVSVVAKSEIADALRRELGLALPHEHISVVKHPTARRAAQANPIAAVSSMLATTLVARGVRVHTIGYDRVTANFFYFAEGGAAAPVKIQGDLLEMIAPVLAYGNENDDIARHLARLIDRILSALSNGVLTELRVELAEALPPIATKGSITPELDVFEREAAALTTESARFRGGSESLASTLESASSRKEPRVPVHLFGEATRVTRTAMDLEVGGHRVALPSRTLWVVSGQITDKPPMSAPPPPAAEVDEAWGEESSSQPVAKPVTPAVAAPTPAPMVAAKPEAKAAKVETPKQPEIKPIEEKPAPAIEAKPAPPIEAKPVTPKQPAVKPIETQPVTPKQPAVRPIESRPTTPKQPAVTPMPKPVVASVAAPVSASAVVSPSVEPTIPAVIAQRTVQLGTPLPSSAIALPPSSRSAPVAVEAPVVAVGARAVDADESDDRDASLDERDEEDDEADGASGASKEVRANKHSGKAASKAAKKAARRAAAKEANRLANAPKTKKRTEPEPKPAVASDAASKSTTVKSRPAPKLVAEPAPIVASKSKSSPATDTKSKSNALPIILAIAVLVALAIVYWMKTKH